MMVVCETKRIKIMKRIICTLVIALLMGSITESKAGSSVNIDVPSGYVWRGITFNDGFIVQPSFDTATDFGLGFNAWANIDIDDYDGYYEKGELSEIDLTVYYSLPLESSPIGADIGYVEYAYIDQGDTNRAAGGTREVYLSIYPKDCPFGSSLTIYYDIDEVEDFYLSLAVSKDIAMEGSPVGVKLGASVGYMGEDMATHYAGGTDGGFSDYLVSATTSYSLSESVSLQLLLAYSDTLDEDVLPEQDVNFFGKLSANYSF